jgi:hypothetical protein
MPKGEVESDRQAFQQVLGRLEGDVGTVIHLIRKSKEQGCFPNTAPFWSLIRMMFPIAESVGDLIYGEKNEKQKKGPTANLTCVLEKEFAARSLNYKGKAETLAMLYRHSLGSVSKQ